MPFELDPPRGDVAELTEQVSLLRAENRGLLRRLDEGERRFRLIARGILRVQEAERGRVSRDLHDGLGQSLTALRMQLEIARGEAGEGPLADRLADAAEVAAQALAEVRQLSHLLRPQMLDQLGLFPTLRWLARTFGDRTGLRVDLEHDADEARFDPEVETLLFRVVQEALTNAGKHSGAEAVTVTVRRDGDRLQARIADTGQGFDPSTLPAADDDAGFGLRGMRERAQLFGGRVRVDSAPGRGTVVELEVPLGAPAEGRS